MPRIKANQQRRSKYDEARKRAVLADVPELGQRGAARKHGVPAGSVNRWVKRYGSTQSAAPGTAGHSASVATASPPATVTAPAVATASPPAPASSPAASANATAKAGARKTARRYTPSEKAQALEYAAAHGMTAASKALGISRFALYQWQKRLQQAAAGLAPSPTSGPGPDELAAQRDREILAMWKKHPGLGPSQIRNQLRRQGVKVSVHTVREVMIADGYRPPKVKRTGHSERYEAVRPNHLWHLDFVHRYIHRSNTFTLILIDDHSRYVVGHEVDDAERADLVLDTFERAVARHGRPEMVMHDKGSAFWAWNGISRFTALLTELGVDQIAAQHKEWNGKVEVFNANLHKELFDVRRFYNVADMRKHLAAHLHWYNHQRTHHALGGVLVPADRYYGRADEVMARLTAGTGRDGRDGLALGTRQLHLLQVVSKNGATEVWLMGRKVLEFGA